jgi:NADH-quinone oxidoreductase subunit N
VDPNVVNALKDIFPRLIPEVVLGVGACVLFLGGTWRAGRYLWGAGALVALAGCGIALGLTPHGPPGRAATFAAPLVFDSFSLYFKIISLVGGAILVLASWDEMPDGQAADYHACLLIIVAGMFFTAEANDLITLFLALELVSIPTYVLLYLPRVDAAAQEAAMKYFLLSIFSSALMLFGFSYLYGLAGTTNLPALTQTLTDAQRMGAALPAVALVALVMVVAGLGFRITAVPFHFYAPDVYQGTAPAAAGLLAFVPKVAGFAALLRVLGFVPLEGVGVGRALGDQVPVLLWILAAVTITVGNLLALLQDNVKRLMAYSSVAHAGYVLIGLAVAPLLAGSPKEFTGGVEAVLFYLVAYGAMTVGVFAVISYLSTPERPVETIDDFAGLGVSRPGVALLMVLFLFSLIGLPVTAGFWGKVLLFSGALGLSPEADSTLSPEQMRQAVEQARLFQALALIGVINAAIGAWYYLRIATVMFLRTPPPRRVEKPQTGPVLAAIWACALITLAVGLYPDPLARAVRAAVPHAEPITMSAATPALAAGEAPRP